jgi:hypothetical protein
MRCSRKDTPATFLVAQGKRVPYRLGLLMVIGSPACESSYW